MERLSYALKKLDWMNKLLLVVGFGLCIASIATGQGRYGLIWLVLICSLVLSRHNNQQKQMMRRYGSLYFHMPDGEIYPVTLEQVRSEYAHGRKSRYNGRKVTIRFPYFCQDSSGALDTGFGLLYVGTVGQQLRGQTDLQVGGELLVLVASCWLLPVISRRKGEILLPLIG